MNLENLQGDGMQPDEQVPLRTLVGRIAHEINSRLPPGDVADLRRITVDRPSCAAYWKLMATQVEPSGGLSGSPASRLQQETRWAVILSGMARTKGLHSPPRRLGQTLAEELSEQRFLRLLRSEGESLWDQVRVITQHLASSARPFDWTALAELVLTDRTLHGERVRRSIARDYYHSVHKHH